MLLRRDMRQVWRRDSRIWHTSSVIVGWTLCLLAGGCSSDPPTASIAAPASDRRDDAQTQKDIPAETQTRHEPDSASKNQDRRSDQVSESRGPLPVTAERPRKVATEIPDFQEHELHEPRVVMTDDHAATCMVGVGDRMPDLEVVDLQDQPRRLSGLLGDRLTVVLIWDTQHVFAAEQFSRMQHDVEEAFAAYGVSVVAINVGDDSDVVRHASQVEDATFASLRDSDGDQLRRIATRKLPRVYVLDADGIVLWFDIEYSRTTERELTNAIKYYLQQGTAPEGDMPLGEFRRAEKTPPV